MCRKEKVNLEYVKRISLKNPYRIWISGSLLVSLNSGVTNPVLDPGIWGIYPVALVAPPWHSFLVPWFSLMMSLALGAVFLALLLPLKSRVPGSYPFGLPVSISSLRGRLPTQIIGNGFSVQGIFYTNGCDHP